jgi:hypothetical protein
LEELEHNERKIEEQIKLSLIGSKFATHLNAIQQQIKSNTIGLVTLDQMKAKQHLVNKRVHQLALKQQSFHLKQICGKNHK